MKKSIGILVILMLTIGLFTFSMAEQDANIYSYTINQAQNIAVENSKQAVLDDKTIQQKQYDLTTTNQTAVNTGAGPDVDSVLNMKLTGNVRPIEAMATLEVAKMTKYDNLRNLKLDVFKSAENILLSHEEIGIAQQKVSISEEKLKFAQSKYNADTITITELQNAEYALDASKLNQEKAMNKLISLEYDFKNFLSLPLDEKSVTINEDLAYSVFSSTDIDGIVKDAFVKNTDIYQKTKNVEAKQKTMDITVGLFKKGDLTYDINSLDLQIAQMDLDDAKTKLEADILNKYNDLLSMQDKLKLSQTYSQIAEKSYKDAQTRFDKGMINKEALLTANEGYIDALYQKNSVIHDYNITKAEFGNMTGK